MTQQLTKKNASTWHLPAGLRLHPDEIEVLDAAAQQRLLHEARLGRQAEELLASGDLDESVAERLRAQVRIGRRATGRLICSNMRLVTWVAHRHQRRQRQLELEDLVQEGVAGLNRAIEKYDPSFGTQFSTYATWWIRQAIGRAIMNAGLVRIPVHAQDGSAYSDAFRALARRFDEIDSIEGISARLDLIEDEMLAEMTDGDWPDVGIDLPIGVAAHGDHADVVDIHTVVTDLLGRLSEREAFVLRCRSSGIDRDPMTLEEIGARLHLTRERVRQIEKAALDKSRALLTAA